MVFPGVFEEEVDGRNHEAYRESVSPGDREEIEKVGVEVEEEEGREDQLFRPEAPEDEEGEHEVEDMPEQVGKAELPFGIPEVQDDLLHQEGVDHMVLGDGVPEDIIIIPFMQDPEGDGFVVRDGDVVGAVCSVG